ncbi:Signal transduction histidine kinase [Lentzea albidocapillata subsp. violacea]|uniref:histidine kinase n=1 Tax=Lentzea albidocapillata subsp. violacea TaxID=128104 RepID=A0A1G8R7B1_9PSEU|nr:histidine kinase [Lentzea albidocapillata]SDJ12723.1 Signal transduction histidine kinase [Lentzea albidocapillata subsp. violacea]
MGELRRRPLVIATVVMVAAVFVVTGRIIGFGRALHLISGPGVGETWFDHPVYTVAESAVVLVLVFAHAWRTPVLVAVPSILALVLVVEHAAFYRPHISLSRADAVQLMLILSIIMVAGGLLLRMRERSRAALAAAAEERARRDERLDMARELHDVVAHHVTGMLVQAQAALVVAAQDKDKACAMLPGIVEGGTDALGAMSAMVRTLRDNGAAGATTDLTADLHRLAERSGLPVRANVELTADVRPELGRSVLRLVQEALTNARKHAFDATSVEVDVRLTSDLVLLSVVDNGTVRPSHSGGFGLVGMRERVHELGGRFFAGPTGEGWLVTAELPLEVRA